jgi:hypothetical protein
MNSNFPLAIYLPLASLSMSSPLPLVAIGISTISVCAVDVLFVLTEWACAV